MHSDDIYTKICTRCNEHMTEEWHGKICMALKLLYLFYVCQSKMDLLVWYKTSMKVKKQRQVFKKTNKNEKILDENYEKYVY